MINTPVIFTPDYNLPEVDVFVDSGEIIYSLIIDEATCFDRLTPYFIHRYKISQNCYFSICFDFTRGGDAFASDIHNFKEIILHYFFHPSYKIIHNKPLICFNQRGTVSHETRKMIAEIEKYAISQGFDGITAVYFSDEGTYSESDINFNSIQFLETIASEYERLLTKKYYCSRYMGINYKDASRTIHKLTEVEDGVLRNAPDLHHQLKEHQELKQQLLQLNEKIILTEKELSAQKDYLKIFKGLDESTKILEFYRYEYEILPLWYKKLGHIIKVLTGKRTFRSLFDNDVKKYND